MYDKQPTQLPDPPQPPPIITKPKFASQSQLLMEIIAISGECASSNITRIIPAQNYGRKLITALVGDGLIRLVSDGGLRGYRLTPKGKKKLLEANPARFRGVLDGDAETSKVRTGYERRLRLHSLAEVCTLMYNAGIEIFQDTKPKIYLLDEGDPETPLSTPDQSSQPSSQSTAINFEHNKTTKARNLDVPNPHQTKNSHNPTNPTIPKINPAPTNPNLPQITLEDWSPNSPTIIRPTFYLSREQKGKHSNAIRGSRAAGTLLTPTCIYAIYNTGSLVSRWTEAIEQRYKAEMQGYICREMLAHQYKGAVVGGIMIGDELGVLERYLMQVIGNDGGGVSAEQQSNQPKQNPKRPKPHATPKPPRHTNHIRFFTNTYHPFYFITNNQDGESQLKLLCNQNKTITLINTLLRDYNPKDPKYPIEHDALTKDGNPVLFCCLLDIPRLIRFKAGLSLHEKAGVVVAFDFQLEFLGRYLGSDEVEFVKLSLDKVMNWLF